MASPPSSAESKLWADENQEGSLVTRSTSSRSISGISRDLALTVDGDIAGKNLILWIVLGAQ